MICLPGFPVWPKDNLCWVPGDDLSMCGSLVDQCAYLWFFFFFLSHSDKNFYVGLVCWCHSSIYIYIYSPCLYAYGGIHEHLNLRIVGCMNFGTDYFSVLMYMIHGSPDLAFAQIMSGSCFALLISDLAQPYGIDSSWPLSYMNALLLYLFIHHIHMRGVFHEDHLTPLYPVPSPQEYTCLYSMPALHAHAAELCLD